ncbi:MAG: hypothetical protein AB7O73_09760, partial [Bacteroidia bacterium]
QFMQILPHFNNLTSLYNVAEVADKQLFLQGIFWGGFTKEKVGGRTKCLNPIFNVNLNEISHLLKVEEIKKPENISDFPFGTRNGT